jgi:hypothetical protein
MQRLTFPRGEIATVLETVLSDRTFEVLAQSRFLEAESAAFVLGRFGWSWGHFYRAAFCAIHPWGREEAALEITFLGAQRQWHGGNLFRESDRRIEDEIAGYLLANIAGARRE